MYPYFVLMAYIALVGMIVRPSKSKRRKVVFLALAFAALAGIAGLRSSSVGADTIGYYLGYTFIGRNGFDAFDMVRYEPGFTALCLALYQVSQAPQFLLLATSVLLNVLVAVFLYRNSENAVLSTYLYVALAIYTQYMCLMRQAIAIAIVINAVSLLLKKRRVLFILLVILAATFHRSAMVCLVFLFVEWIGFGSKHIVAYLAICVIVFLYASALSDFVATLLSRDRLYREKYMGSNYYGALIKMLFHAALSFVALNYIELGKRRGIIADDVKTQLIEHALMLWVVFSILGVRIQIWGRIACYFQPFILVGIPLALRVPSPKERQLITAVICIVALAHFVVIGVFRPEWQDVIPYTVNGHAIRTMLGLP